MLVFVGAFGVLRNGNSYETLRWRWMLLRGPKDLVARGFSSGYSSVHGERPSAEYAKLRKESLETQFGLALGLKSVSMFYRFGPFLALYRAAIISFHVLKLTIWSLFVQAMNKLLVELEQALSTRPAILPTAYCQELAKLQDQIPPFPTDVALNPSSRSWGCLCRRYLLISVRSLLQQHH